MIENRTILLIDDEPQIRRVLKTSLGSKGARVLDVGRLARLGRERRDACQRHARLVVLPPGLRGE